MARHHQVQKGSVSVKLNQETEYKVQCARGKYTDMCKKNEMKTKMLACAKECASFLSQEGEVGKLGQATFPRQNNSYSHFQATCVIK